MSDPRQDATPLPERTEDRPGGFYPRLEAANAEIATLRSQISSVCKELESERKSSGELWDERTRLRDALFTIQHEVCERRIWSDVCEKAMARALLPLGTPGDPVPPSALRERSE